MYPVIGYAVERMIVEFASATICFVLVWFMLKPYKLTRNGCYLGLPLGFGFLGLSWLINGVSISQTVPTQYLIWVATITKSFAFGFIAATYFLIGRNQERTNKLGNSIIGLLLATLLSSIVIAFIAPQFAGYIATNMYLRAFNVACLVYVVFFTLRNHIKNPDPSTIWIPLGFVFLAVSQYSLLFWYIDSSFSAFVGSIILRFIGLGIFLLVAYRSFYKTEAG